MQAFWTERWESLVYGRRDSPAENAQRLFLGFCSRLYGAGIGLRNRAYDRGLLSARRVTVPVVSIGNVSVGGSGKTTLARWCAEKILERGGRPAVLSRGYGRRTSEREIRVVSDGASILESAEAAGDEPRLLAAGLPRVPVLVGADRAASAALAIARFRPGCLILDDGFQHRRLARDLDLVCLDESLLKAPRLFPRGALREPVAALGRAHFLAVKSERGLDEFKEDFRTILGAKIEKPCAHFTYEAAALRERPGGKLLPLDGLKGRAVLACSGIARPESFEALAERAGAEVRASRRFPDHHFYSDADLKGLEREAREKGCTIVTTAKDAVKLPDSFPAYVLEIGIAWRQGREELERALWAAAGCA